MCHVKFTYGSLNYELFIWYILPFHFSHVFVIKNNTSIASRQLVGKETCLLCLTEGLNFLPIFFTDKRWGKSGGEGEYFDLKIGSLECEMRHTALRYLHRRNFPTTPPPPVHNASTGGHFRQIFFCWVSFRNVEICLIKTITVSNHHLC